jgi:hypothetical protein
MPRLVARSTQVLFPKYDPDTRMVFVSGKGDGNIRYFEIDDEAPYAHNLSEYKSSTPQRGVTWLPKQCLDINACEVARGFKLHPKGFIEVIGFTVPRKSTLFQEDIYPPTKEPVAVLTADEWLAGQTKPPQMMSLKDNFVKVSRTGGAKVGVAPAKVAGVNPYAKAPAAAAAAPAKPAVTASKPAAGVNPYAKKAAPAPAPAPAPEAPAAEAAAAPAAAGGGACCDSAAEVKALKTKLATKEIEIARLKKEIAELKA